MEVYDSPALGEKQRAFPRPGGPLHDDQQLPGRPRARQLAQLRAAERAA